MDKKPFELEVDCGSANPVRFTLSEDQLRHIRAPLVMFAIADKRGDPDDRTRLWRGAVELAGELIKKSDAGPLRIQDGSDVWVIPERVVRWVRVHDPEEGGKRGKEIGFRLGDETPTKVE
ncbi:MAG: hypothetical protein ACHQ01_07985 [Candidatus Limnocylindrales bacterium]